MAKDKEKKLAEHYYIDKGLTAKEAALKVGVTEATMSNWVRQGGWRARRDAILTSAATRYSNLEEVMSSIAEDRLALGKELKEAIAIGDMALVGDIRKKLAKVDDGAAKWGKNLMTAKGDTEISLSVYIEVMERLFGALRNYDEKLYLQTITFQERHLNDIATR